jgi:hypothetical protein
MKMLRGEEFLLGRRLASVLSFTQAALLTTGQESRQEVFPPRVSSPLNLFMVKLCHGEAFLTTVAAF